MDSYSNVNYTFVKQAQSEVTMLLSLVYVIVCIELRYLYMLNFLNFNIAAVYPCAYRVIYVSYIYVLLCACVLVAS